MKTIHILKACKSTQRNGILAVTLDQRFSIWASKAEIAGNCNMILHAFEIEVSLLRSVHFVKAEGNIVKEM